MGFLLVAAVKGPDEERVAPIESELVEW